MKLGRGRDKSNQFNTARYMKRALLKLKSQYFYFKKFIVIIDFAILMKVIITDDNNKILILSAEMHYNRH